MSASDRTAKHLVLIGGGHSHAAVLAGLGESPPDGVRVTLIARDLLTPYSGMLPGHIAGHYALADCHIDLRPLARRAGAALIHDSAVGLDLVARRVRCADHAPVDYDVVSIDIGSAPRTDLVPGAAENAVPVKPIGQFVAHWEALARRLRASGGGTSIAVVGGGAGGVELVLAIRHRLREMLAEGEFPGQHIRFHLFTDRSEIMAGHNARVRRKFDRILAERGVAVHTDSRVVRVGEGRLECADGGAHAADEILWVTEAGAAPWPGESGLDVDAGGFIRVDDCLRSLSHPEVFAAGDVANVVNHPRPKAGVFAVRQGQPLLANLRRVLAGQAPKPFAPQQRFLSIVSTGDKYAVASRGALAFEGRWVWRFKDWVDRRWMRRYVVARDG